MVGIVKNNNFQAIVIGGAADHVHVLLALPTSVPIAKAVQLIKGGSSKWFNEEYSGSNFAWQRGFAAFSVSQSQCAVIENYIRNQEGHHKKRDFAAEFIALLRKNNVPYDPKYVFG
jgi:putative transposase